MKIIVTSGGVRERIDNVRSITNSSSGKLGSKIAMEFLNKRFQFLEKSLVNKDEFKVYYIYGGNAKPLEVSNGVANIRVNSTKELLNTISDLLKNEKIDIFIHSMAVADYYSSFVFDLDLFKQRVKELGTDNVDSVLYSCRLDTENKMSSDIKNPCIVLDKNPKVIHEIKKLSPYTFLVGFKLLDDVSEETLFDVGFDLLRKNRCNLVLANDISKIRKGNHEGLLIYPEKTYDKIVGKDSIAKMLVEKCLERYFVGHPKSVQVSKENNISEDLFEKFKEMGAWLNQEGYLPKVVNHDRTDKMGTYGNMSCKKDDCFYITCRNVNKGDLKRTDLSLIKMDEVKTVENSSVYSIVMYNSEIKPSIDTTIHHRIYQISPYSHIVHIHTNRTVLGYPSVLNSYPCGCDLECNSIIELLKKNPMTRVIQMRKHGWIVMGNSFEECRGTIEELMREPYIDYEDNNIDSECIEHIKEVCPQFIKGSELFVIKQNKMSIGCLWERLDNEYVHFGIYTMNNIRGKGLHIVEKYLKLYQSKYMLHTTMKCDIADFYMIKYGFIPYFTQKQDDMQYIKG